MSEGLSQSGQERDISFSADISEEDKNKAKVGAFLEVCRSIKSQKSPTSPGGKSEVGGLGAVEMMKVPKPVRSFFGSFEPSKEEMPRFDHIGRMILSGRIEEVDGWEEKVGGLYKRYLEQLKERKKRKIKH